MLTNDTENCKPEPLQIFWISLSFVMKTIKSHEMGAPPLLLVSIANLNMTDLA